MKKQTKQEKRLIRHKRVRGRIFGTAKRPRLYVFRSGRHVYAQLIDDEKRKTLASAGGVKDFSKKTMAGKGKTKDSSKLTAKLATAFEVGELIAKRAKGLKIDSVIFDRGGYLYHGRVKALADGARKGGLKF